MDVVIIGVGGVTITASSSIGRMIVSFFVRGRASAVIFVNG